ncbi:hypothetical protein KY320_00965, partial [Candidatus Woesearchaeota archaeon]|nr:hypothetical protein [Candidatus Woesearchaeota archaeon]
VFVTDDDSVHFSGTIESSSTTVDGDDIGADNSLAPGEIALVQFESDDMASETGKLLRGTLVTKYKYKGGVVEQECTGSIRVKAS